VIDEFAVWFEAEISGMSDDELGPIDDRFRELIRVRYRVAKLKKL